MTPDLTSSRFRYSRDGLLRFEGSQLVEANGVGVRTFRAPGHRRGEQWVPWLEQQLMRARQASSRQTQSLYQREIAGRIAQYDVRIRHLPGGPPSQLLVRSHFLGWVPLQGADPARPDGHPEELQQLLDSTLVGQLLLAADGRVLYANAVAAGLFGRSPQALQGSYLGQTLQVGQVVEIDIPVRGELRTAEVSLVPLPWPRERVYLMTLTDVSERNRSREQLQLLRQAWEQSPVALVITDAQQQIEYVNPTFEQMTGYRFEEVQGKSPHLLASGETPPDVYRQLWTTLNAGQVWRGEFLNRRRSGDVYWEEARIAPVRDAGGAVTHYVGVKEDISERKRTEQLLHTQANYDALTGLPNRQLLLRLLESLLLLEKRRKRRLAVLFLDLDRFKAVNDQAGHAVGDRLLQVVARRLRQAVRAEDIVARQSGDEFILICPDLDSPLDAQPVAERVLDRLQEPVTIGEQTFYVGGSIGISSFPEGGRVAEDLLQQADQAMYSAKQSGGDQLRFYSAELNAQRAWRQRAETLLRRAIDREELSVVYQPIVSLIGGHPVGAEALLRWHSAELGVVSPERFIELAETTGQIERIGAWVLDEATTAVRSWQTSGPEPLWVSVNLSPHQLRSAAFPQQVKQQLWSSRLGSGQLKLEVTEQQLLEDVAQMSEHLRTLDQEGIHLAIDDFGTGYSSLAYLRHFPFRILKIDRSFIRDVPYHRDACVLVRTILAMAAELDLKVVAEGIETEDQLNFLLRYGCRYGQGYLFSRPLGLTDFRSWLQGFESATPPAR